MLNFLRAIERLVLVTIFFAMVLLYSTGIVTREMGGTLAGDFAWVDEAVRLLNTALVFLALGLGLERGRHVGIDTLNRMIPDSLRFWVLKLIDLVGFLFSVYIAWLGYGLASFVFSTGQRSPTLGLETGWTYVVPTIGFLLLGLRFALSLLGVIDRDVALKVGVEQT